MRIMKKILDKLNNIFYINSEIYRYRKDIHMNDTTTYVLKDIDKVTWRKFRAKALLAGYDSVAELLRDLIDIYGIHESIPKRRNDK